MINPNIRVTQSLLKLRSSLQTVAATALLVAIGHMAVPTDAEAKVRITERTKYYTVTGTTGKAVARSIQRRGPKASRGSGHAIASTRTIIKIKNLKMGVRQGRCVVTNADVIVDLLYTFPRWRNIKRAKPATAAAWRKFYSQIERHEFTHGRISREYGRDLEKRIKKLSGRVSKGCLDFGKRQARRLKQLRNGYIKRQRRFDIREGRARARVRRLQKVFVNSR